MSEIRSRVRGLLVVWFVMCSAAIVLAMVGWVRLAPLPQDRLVAHPAPETPGEHMLPGGVKWVLKLSDLPPEAMRTLCDIIQGTPRTLHVQTLARDDKTFVTRTRRVGFPDITRVWVKDGDLHIHGHQVFGRRDFGVNAARVARWVELLRAEA